MIEQNSSLNIEKKQLLMVRLSEHIDELYRKPRLRNLFWEATVQCNLSCLHCGSNCNNIKHNDSLTGKEMRTFLYHFANEFSAQEVMLHITGGEPLLRNDLFDVMRFAADLGFIWGITTNGILLTENVIQEMIRTNCRTISVSLDGLKDTHNMLRGCNCFNIVLNNIRNLVDSKGFSNIQVTTVVHKENIHELNNLLSLIEELNVDSWRLTSIEPIGRAKKMEQLFLSADDYHKLLSFIKDSRQNRTKIPVSFGCSHYTTPEYERDIRDHYFFCGTGIITASILHNGDIYVCPDVERKKSLLQGNIKIDNFSEVWFTGYKQFRKRRDLLSQTCIDCSDSFFCRGDSAHSWDFEMNIPKCCLKKLFTSTKYIEKRVDTE